MTQEELSRLTDQELSDRAKKMKKTSITNAVLIGFVVGIIIYSIVKKSVDFFTLIPLIFIYKVYKDSKNNNGLEEELKARKLK